MMKRLAIWSALALGMLLLPASGSPQSAFDPRFPALHNLTDPIPRAKIVTGAYQEFMVPIDTLGSKEPTRSLRLLVGTHGRTNHCTVRLRLLKTDAEPIACETISDNDFLTFSFPIPIGDAEYPAKVWVEDGGAQDGISLYLQQDKYKGTYWTMPQREVESANVIGPLGTWYAGSPPRALGYFLLLAAALAIAACRKPWRLPALTGLLYLGNAMIAPYFTGHDETAHLTMFRYAYIEATLDEPGVLPPLQDPLFNTHTTRLMYESRFFRAHYVSLASETQCPHMILGSCGVTEGPEIYYRGLSHVLQMLGINLVEPEDFLLAARVTNLITYAGVLLLLLLCLGREGLRAGTWCLLLGGAMLAEAASISNDNYMFAIGVLGGGAVYAALSPRIPAWRALLVLAIFTVFDLISRQIDDSAYAAVPVIGCAALLLAVRGLEWSRGRGPDVGAPKPYAIATLATLFATVGVFFAATRTMPAVLAEPIHAFSIRAAWLIGLIPKPSKHVIATALHYNLTATFGSFVWGHSTVWTPLLVVLSLALLGLSLCALLMPRWRTRRYAAAAGVAIGILAAGHLLMVTSVLAYFTRPGVLLTAAVMPRFFGTDFSALLAAAGCGFYHLKDRDSPLATWVERGLIAWILLLLFHYLPRFYIADFL